MINTLFTEEASTPLFFRYIRDPAEAIKIKDQIDILHKPLLTCQCKSDTIILFIVCDVLSS